LEVKNTLSYGGIQNEKIYHGNCVCVLSRFVLYPIRNNFPHCIYAAFKGGKLGSLNIEIDGEVQKVTGGDIQKLYWSEDDNIQSIEVKETLYLFHTHYAVVDVYTDEYAGTTHSYIIEKIDSEYYHGIAEDGTGVVFTDTELKGQQIKLGDQVEVSYLDYETITNVEKVN
jgi:hypothetical protein